MLVPILACHLTATPSPALTGRVTSKDALVRWTPEAIRLETSRIRLTLSVQDGRLVRSQWLDRQTNRDLLGGKPTADFTVRYDGHELSSADPGWTITPPHVTRQKNRELLVEVRAGREGLEVRRFFLVFPGLSLIREWMELRGAEGGLLEDPQIGRMALRGEGALRLRWMTGAEPWAASWQLREEALPPGAQVTHDSYDPPPAPVTMNDGVDARILQNETPVWPEAGWARSAHSADVKTHAVTVDMRAGDRLLFVVGRHGNITCDTTEWDPAVIYADGQKYQASAGFADTQEAGPWRYGYLGDDGKLSDMVYDPAPGRYGKRWRRRLGVTEPFVAAVEMHPDGQGSAVRIFVAPRDGRVRVEGSLRNTGNTAPSGPGFRMGSQTYAPWFCLQDERDGQAVYAGFDCIAHWRAAYQGGAGEATAGVRLAGFRKKLKVGEIVRTPTFFSGVFQGDLDEMGQELLEWQYRYMWDYTRDPWFAGVRLLGYWFKGTKWNTAFASEYNDPEAAYRKAFRMADLMRQVGGDTFHRDWGWWDKAGDWNGPDFRAVNDYLRQYGMGLLMYAHIYAIEPDSSVAKAHPDWLIGGGELDQSLPQVVDYEANLLDEFYRRWGPYQYRNDANLMAPRDGDDTSLLAQQQGFFEVIRRFHDAHPDCGMHGVNGGGFALNWEYLRLTSGFQFTDGQATETANYYASYLFPPDKINNMPDIWDPAKFDPATWRGLLCANIDFTGDTFELTKLEGIRLILDIYHYLLARGVAGRWVRVYHPPIDGDNPAMYLQRLSWDRKCGVIITKHAIKGKITIRPKGLLPEASYQISYQEASGGSETSGQALMRDGITLTDPAPGEIIYLNLPDHPGNRLDSTPPGAPRAVTCREARWMGVPGVEVRWKATRDDRWLSGYEVSRDGERLDFVAKGCFYFDHSAGADPAARYAVRAVDGAGNASSPVEAKGRRAPRRRVLDDTETQVITWAGDWQRETGILPAYRQTLSHAETAGASFTVRFTGRRIVWHAFVGAQGGLAMVTVDKEPPVQVSCFTADEIPGWPLFERTWPDSGPHTLKVEVLGKPDPRSKGTRVWVDGIAVTP